jgi:excisionase family DNA binding protein
MVTHGDTDMDGWNMVVYGGAMPPQQKIRYSVDEAAAILGVHPNTVWRRLRDGRIPRLRDEGRTFIDHAELYRYARTSTEARNPS